MNCVQLSGGGFQLRLSFQWWTPSGDFGMYMPTWAGSFGMVSVLLKRPDWAKYIQMYFFFTSTTAGPPATGVCVRLTKPEEPAALPRQ